MLILYCLVVHRSMQLVINAYSKHSHLPNFLNNFISFSLNSVSNLSTLPLVIRHRPASPIFYHITSLQGPRIHLLVTYFLFPDTTLHLALALFCAFVTSSHPLIPNTLFFHYVSLRCTSFTQPILPPIAAPIMRPDYLLGLWCYILTYLLRVGLCVG